MWIPRPINHKAPSQLSFLTWAHSHEPFFFFSETPLNKQSLWYPHSSDQKKTTLEHPWVPDKWILKPCFAVNKQNKSSNLLQFHLNGIIVVFMTNAAPRREYEHSWTGKERADTSCRRRVLQQPRASVYFSLKVILYFESDNLKIWENQNISRVVVFFFAFCHDSSMAPRIYRFVQDLKISQLLDWLTWNFVQTFMVPRRLGLLALMVPWLLIQHRVDVCLWVKYLSNILDGLWLEFGTDFIFPSGWILITQVNNIPVIQCRHKVGKYIG